MNPIPEKVMNKYHRILDKYSSSDYARLEDNKLYQLIELAGREGKIGSLERIRDMAMLESRRNISALASITLDKVVHEPAMASTPEQHAVYDLGEIYLRINYAARNGDTYALANLKKAGMILGHTGVVEYASEKLGEPVTQRDYLHTLEGAIKQERGSIDDPSTSLGKCFLAVFGNQLETLLLASAEDSTTKIPYKQLPREEKDKVNMQIVSTINIPLLENMVAEREAQAQQE